MQESLSANRSEQAWRFLIEKLTPAAEYFTCSCVNSKATDRKGGRDSVSVCTSELCVQLKYSCHAIASSTDSSIRFSSASKCRRSSRWQRIGRVFPNRPTASCNPSYKRPSQAMPIAKSAWPVRRQRSVCQQARKKIDGEVLD